MNGQFHDSDDRFTAGEVCWYSLDRRLGRPKSQFGLSGEKALTPNGNHMLNPLLSSPWSCYYKYYIILAPSSDSVDFQIVVLSG
jgi:hypothetical protein